MRRLFLTFLVVFLFVVSSVLAQTTPLDDGWNMIEPGGDTICSRGTPYHFYAREGTSDNLLIDFQGGGACWNALSCSEQFGTFNASLDLTDPFNSPGYGGSSGIYDLDNPENPFADYDMVFVSYCTGDVHMGDSVTTYERNNASFEINHKGVVNANAALDWAYANFDAPESVFVNGCSAGSLGASFHAPNILAHYDGVRAAVLGDSAGGLRGNLTAQFGAWNTLSVLPDFEGYADETLDSLSFNTFWLEATALFPDVLFSEYNTVADETQTYLARLAQGGISYEDGLPANLSDIAASADNFASYTQGGDLHCITPYPEFYTYSVGDVRLRNWVADLAAGQSVETVACTECDSAELVSP